MTDVRLTATNPEDSSVVPVACNERGELLVTDVVIEEIPNALTIDGDVSIKARDDDYTAISLKNSSYVSLKNGPSTDPVGEVRMSMPADAMAIGPDQQTFPLRIKWNGQVQAPTVLLSLEASNPDHYVETTRDGESVKEYKGPTMDVGEELRFLRAQVQALMERLKMTPEGGWPVWDGSDQ